MKRALVTFVALVLVLCMSPVGALVRELDSETEARLTGIVLEQTPGQVTSTRIRDFWNISRSVFCLTLDLGEEVREIYIDIDSEEILTEADLDQLQADEDAAQEDEPVPYPDTVLDPNPNLNQPSDELPVTGSNEIFYWLGGIVLGGIVLLGMKLKKA